MIQTPEPGASSYPKTQGRPKECAPMKRAIFGIVLMNCAVWLAFGQQPETQPRFEIADVHVSPKTANQFPFMRTGPVRGGRYEVENASGITRCTRFLAATLALDGSTRTTGADREREVSKGANRPPRGRSPEAEARPRCSNGGERSATTRSCNPLRRACSDPDPRSPGSCRRARRESGRRPSE